MTVGSPLAELSLVAMLIHSQSWLLQIWRGFDRLAACQSMRVGGPWQSANDVAVSHAMAVSSKSRDWRRSHQPMPSLSKACPRGYGRQTTLNLLKSRPASQTFPATYSWRHPKSLAMRLRVERTQKFEAGLSLGRGVPWATWRGYARVTRDEYPRRYPKGGGELYLADPAELFLRHPDLRTVRVVVGQGSVALLAFAVKQARAMFGPKRSIERSTLSCRQLK